MRSFIALPIALFLAVGLAGCDATTSADPAVADARSVDEPNPNGPGCAGRITVLNATVGQNVRVRIDDLHSDADYSSHDLQYKPPGENWKSAQFPVSGDIQEGQIAAFPYTWTASTGFAVQYRLKSSCFDSGSLAYSDTRTSYPVVHQ